MSANNYAQLSDSELRSKLLQHGFDIPVSVNRELLLRKLQTAETEAKKNGRKSTGGIQRIQPLAAATAAAAQRARHSMGPTATAPVAAPPLRRRTPPARVQELELEDESEEEEEEEEEEPVRVPARPPPAAAAAAATQPVDPRRSQRYSNYLNLFRQTAPPEPQLQQRHYNSRQFSDDEEEDEDAPNSRSGLKSYLNPFNWKRRTTTTAAVRPAKGAGGTPTATSAAASRLSKYITTTRQQQQQNGQSRHANAESGWDTPKLLLLLGAIFFCLIAGGYYYKGQQQLQQSAESIGAGVWPVCGKQDVEPNHCIPKDHLPAAHNLFSLLKEELQRRADWAHCGANVEERLSLEEAKAVLQRLSEMGKPAIDSIFPSTVKLVVANFPRWGVRVHDGEGEPVTNYTQVTGLDFTTAKIDSPVPATLFCVVWKAARVVVGYGLWIGGAILLTYALVWLYTWRRRSALRAEEEMLVLVQQVLDLLQNHYEETKDSSAPDFLAINHIRDSLIPLQERNAKAALWLRAQQYISTNESRIREEVQHIAGEEYVVWRWLPHAVSPALLRRSMAASASGSPSTSASSSPTPPGGNKWQGQAFEMDEGSPNSLPASTPTCCLKIRHMYDEGSGAAFPKIEAAILEKCAAARILHIGIDPHHAQEGCVYVKCATREDARRAYMEMHGWWYDGRLLSVKFLREERYVARFPEASPAAVVVDGRVA